MADTGYMYVRTNATLFHCRSAPAKTIGLHSFGSLRQHGKARGSRKLILRYSIILSDQSAASPRRWLAQVSATWTTTAGPPSRKSRYSHGKVEQNVRHHAETSWNIRRTCAKADSWRWCEDRRPSSVSMLLRNWKLAGMEDLVWFDISAKPLRNSISYRSNGYLWAGTTGTKFSLKKYSFRSTAGTTKSIPPNTDYAK